MNINDFSALCELRIRCLKVVDVKDVKKIIESEVTNVGDVLTSISSYDAVEYVYSNVKLDRGLDVEAVFNELSSYWINELFNVLKIASADLVRFVKTYLTRYVVPQLIRGIKYLQVGSSGRPKHIFKCLDYGLSSVSDVNDIIKVVRGCREFDSAIVTEVLRSYADQELDEVDVRRLEKELDENYWSRLIVESYNLKGSINLHYAVRLLRDFHRFDMIFKQKSILGEDVSDLLKLYDYSIYRKIVRDLSIDSYDYVSNMFKYLYISSILKYSPLSYDTLLYYMLAKEWEAITLSYIIYVFTNRLDPTYVRKSLKALVDVYGSHH